jgi:hypothetical protein
MLSQLGGRISGDCLRLVLQEVGSSVPLVRVLPQPDEPCPKPLCPAPELASLLDGSTAGELIPGLARHGLQQLIELEVAAVIGDDRHERTEDRHGYRNGYRHRSLTTQVGDIDLLIPKLRAGSFPVPATALAHCIEQIM